MWSWLEETGLAGPKNRFEEGRWSRGRRINDFPERLNLRNWSSLDKHLICRKYPEFLRLQDEMSTSLNLSIWDVLSIIPISKSSVIARMVIRKTRQPENLHPPPRLPNASPTIMNLLMESWGQICPFLHDERYLAERLDIMGLAGAKEEYCLRDTFHDHLQEKILFVLIGGMYTKSR
jgi:hypothetical protein